MGDPGFKCQGQGIDEVSTAIHGDAVAVNDKFTPLWGATCC